MCELNFSIPFRDPCARQSFGPCLSVHVRGKLLYPRLGVHVRDQFLSYVSMCARILSARSAGFRAPDGPRAVPLAPGRVLGLLGRDERVFRAALFRLLRMR